MTQTHNINLNLLHSHQIHKEILINENSIIIDAMMNTGIQSMKINEPNLDSEVGDKYIVPSNSLNDWNGMENHIAIKLQDRWIFIKPKNGMVFWLIDEESLIVYSKNAWKKIIDNKL